MGRWDQTVRSCSLCQQGILYIDLKVVMRVMRYYYSYTTRISRNKPFHFKNHSCALQFYVLIVLL